jgi:hypothetical protein
MIVQACGNNAPSPPPPAARWLLHASPAGGSWGPSPLLPPPALPAGGCTAAPVCGLAVLEVMREEGLQDNAARVGAYCLRLLRELQVGGGVGGGCKGDWAGTPSRRTAVLGSAEMLHAPLPVSCARDSKPGSAH